MRYDIAWAAPLNRRAVGRLNVRLMVFSTGGSRVPLHMDMINPRAYRQMRTEILDHFCDQLEHEAPEILERCDQPFLLERAERIYLAGGMPLPEGARDKPELIRRIVRAAELFLMHAVEQRMMWIGDFESEKTQTQAAAEQEFEAWISRFHAWAGA